MHNANLDLSIEEITKIEGNASVEIAVRDGIVTECKFAIVEMRRFFMQAIRGKPVAAVPGLVARICGTCSNAHMLASLKAIENALGITVTPQVKLLRQLLNYGLIIRDHALHLYVFVLPDVYNRDSILSFAEDNHEEHQLVHDCFDVKEAGNKLAIAVGGRSVHAPLARIGGFVKNPTQEELRAILPILEGMRPAILRLIDVFMHKDAVLEQQLKFIAEVDAGYSFLDGAIRTDAGETITDSSYRSSLTLKKIPYSEATGYQINGQTYFVGALARMNLNRTALHAHTKRDAAEALSHFPSSNIHHNNLAQAIEILHSIDASIDLVNAYQAIPEPAVPVIPKNAVGYGIIEAPRGTLLHEVTMTDKGVVTDSHVIVPTGQNQIGIENAIREYVGKNLDKTKEELSHEIERIIRSYDPCMSCASHFLKVKWV
jgi:sulfhydrogenase subunit alpha